MKPPGHRGRSSGVVLRMVSIEGWIALGMTAVPILVILVLSSRAAPGWMPVTDWALIELRVRDVGRSVPLLGVPSAVGFHHPGPMMYLMLAPLYRLFGSDPAALLVSAASLNCAAIAGSAWVAWRRGGLWLTVLVVALSVTLAGSAVPGFLFDPWNPWLALLPFVWFILLVWSVIEGDLWLSPVAIVVGSFLAQTHIGYAVPVAVLAMVASLSWGVRRIVQSRQGATPLPRSYNLAGIGAACIAAVAVCWAGPLYEQVTRNPGNVSTMFDLLVSPGARNPQPLLGSAEMLGILAREMAWNGPWAGATEPVDTFSSVVPRSMWALVFPLGMLLLTAVLLFGRRLGRTQPAAAELSPTDHRPLGRDSVARLFLVNCAATAALVVSIARLETGRVFPYIVRGMWAVVALSVLIVAMAAMVSLRDRRPDVDSIIRRAMTTLAAVLLIVSTAGLIADAGDEQIPIYNPDVASNLARCTRILLEGVRADARSEDVHLSTTETVWPVLAAPLVNELDRLGTSVDIEPKLEFFFDRPGVVAAPNVVPYQLVTGDEIDVWNAKRGVRPVVACDLLAPADRAFMTSSMNRPDPTPAERQRAYFLSRSNLRATVYRLPLVEE